MSRALVFDFDGVLADTLGDMLRFAKQVCADLGYPCTPSPADLEALDRMSFADYGRQLGLPQERLDDFCRGSFALFSSRQEPPPIFDGIGEVVARLAATHKIGIVTGNIDRVVRDFLQRHGLAGAIHAVLDVNAPGSRADKIRQMTEVLGEPASKTYVIGDAVSDFRAARQAGAKSVAVTWGHQSRAKLARAGPDHWVETPADLLALFQGASG